MNDLVGILLAIVIAQSVALILVWSALRRRDSTIFNLKVINRHIRREQGQLR